MVRTVVLGTGISGLAVARYLLSLGRNVVVSDRRTASEVEASPLWEEFSSLEKVHEGKLSWAFDGHPESLLENCQEVVVSPGVSLHIPFLQAALSRGVRITGEIELAYTACPKPVVAVTGTNGKSTTCSLLGLMFAECGIVGGNIGIPLLDQVQDLPSSVEWVVAEVSSFQMETVHTFRPRIGVLTNITPDHLDHHKDLSEYRVAKSRMFAQMGFRDTAVFCWDDVQAKEIMAEVAEGRLPEWIDGFPKPAGNGAPTILAYSVKEAVPCGVGFTFDREGRRWVSRFENGQATQLFVWDFPGLPGPAMMSNGLAAVAAGLSAGLSLQKIQDGLRRFQPLRYRMELAGVVDGISYINDSKATNIDSALAAANAVSGPLAVIVGGKDKGVDYSSLAEGLAKRGGRVFLIGEAATPIGASLGTLGFTNLEVSGTLGRAVEDATRYLNEGGTVLLAPACSSFDQFKSAEQRGEIFNEMVAELKKTRSS